MDPPLSDPSLRDGPDTATSTQQGINGMEDEMFPRCASCGDRIGVYEALAVEDEAGSLVPSSWRAVSRRSARGETGLRVLHADCARSLEPSRD